MCKRFLTIAVIAGFALFALPVFAYSSPGSPTGYVNDFADVISDEAEGVLETQLDAFEKETTHEVSVVTITTLDGDYIENYANELFRDWGIGKKENDNGLLFLVAVDDREMRVEVGYGLEGAVTDLETKYIQDTFARPAFREGDYSGGITTVVGKLQEAAREEIVPEGYGDESTFDLAQWLFFGFWALIFVFPWLASVLGRSKSWWAGGVIGAVVGGICGAITGFWGFVPIAGLLGLLFDYLVSKNFKAGKDQWWTGGGSGGWGGGSSGGSSGGFGGFGGGSSGGGGSSSSW